MSGSRARRGLTLIEILVATALVAFLIASATAGFVQIRDLARRIDARQQLHNSARLVFERLNSELSSLMNGSAFFAIGSAGTVEVVFLRGKLDNVDFMLGNAFGAEADSLTDQLWTRWYFEAAKQQLSLAASSAARSFDQDKSWVTGGYDYNARAKFRNLPTPQRVVVGASPATTLNANAYGTGASNDIGDYTDLENNSVPILSNCSGFALEIVCEDGSTHAISASAAGSLLSDGQKIDGRAGAALASRPRLVRTRLDLTDPATGISETFSFSFLTPALSIP
jgi:prepilin-type N-terminal cleavage/methylation domain-containing protein